jgi:hypothetical protein
MLALLDFDGLQHGAINFEYKVIFKDDIVVIMEKVSD